MKHISLLGILAILIIIGEFIFSLPDMSKEFQEGFNDGYEQNKIVMAENGTVKKIEHFHRVSVEVTPIESIPADTLQATIPYQTSQIECYIEPSTSFLIFSPAILIGLLAVLYGMYSLIRLLIRISRKDVFSRKNIWWLRWFTYSYTGFCAILGLLNLMLEQSALQQINIPGYTVDGITSLEIDWGTLAVMILLTEIFAVGVKLKEEQDLTI